MATKEDLHYVAGIYENAGTIPSSRNTGGTAFLIANNPYRREILDMVQRTLALGTIETFESNSGKEFVGLFMTKQEWVKALTKLTPYFRTEDRKFKIQRAINSLKG